MVQVDAFSWKQNGTCLSYGVNIEAQSGITENRQAFIHSHKQQEISKWNSKANLS